MGRNGYQIFLTTWKEGLSSGSQRPDCLRVVSMNPPWEDSTMITAAVSGADTVLVEQTGQKLKLWLVMGEQYVSGLNSLEKIGRVLGLAPDKDDNGYVLVGTQNVAQIRRKDTFEALGVEGFARVFGVEEAAAECFRLATLSKQHAGQGVIHAAKCALLESLDEGACLSGLRLTRKRLLDPIYGMQLVSSGSRALLQELVSKYSAVLAFIEENLPHRSLNYEVKKPLDRLELLLLLGEAGDVSGQHCLGRLSCGQALDDDRAFHVVLEVLIAMVDDRLLITHATPELIEYLQLKSNLAGDDLISPEASGYAHLLARVHREQGNSLAAATIFRALGHRAEGVALSLRIQYVAAAVEQYKAGEHSDYLEDARHDLRVALVQERLVRRLELLHEDNAIQRLSSRLAPAQELHDFYTQDFQIWDISLHLVALMDANPGHDIVGRLWDLHMAQGWHEHPEANLMEKFRAVCCRVAELAHHLRQLPCSRDWSFPLEHLSSRLEGMAAGELPEPHGPLPSKECAAMIAAALAQGADHKVLAKFYFGLVSKQWISRFKDRLEETYMAIRATAQRNLES
ncbi:unnamed protein product [Ostreobium quekettii]|uniref:Nucleoporin Nup133/Nup155-like C-terminal domain-containing protein n=1 Tax=Ostreobium quekettii TaxID=121088 RepID=A0A8S1IZ45_9CHLO|nr:unnamed protein product [Ostreobium quekettii]